MAVPTVTEIPSGIFSDASIISTGRYDSNHYGSYNSDVAEQFNSDVAYNVADGIVLSPTEAQMFKKVQKIVLENKSLKNALVENSTRLQEHVDDCIQWKQTHKGIEDDLRKQLNDEKQKSMQLQSSLDFYSTGHPTAGTDSTMDLLLEKLSKQLEMLLNAGNLITANNYPSEDDRMIMTQAYDSSINAVKDFFTGRKFDLLNIALSQVINLCMGITSNESKILKDAISNIEDLIKEYHSGSTNTSQTSHQIPLIQHLQLKHQLELKVKENQEIKNRSDEQFELYNQKEELCKKLHQEKDDLKRNMIEKNSMINTLLAKVEELENSRSVEVLDLIPQQQPKEIKQLEANLESYKRTIDTLKERNEELNNDLIETTECFEKAEEENGELKEQIRLLEAEVNKCTDGVSMSDNIESNKEQKAGGLQCDSSVSELEKQIKLLTEELNTLRDTQLITYELSDHDGSGGIPKEELLEQLQFKEGEINASNEKLRLKMDECKMLTQQLRNVEEELRIKCNEDLNSSNAAIKQSAERLQLKDEEIGRLTELLKDLQCKCDDRVDNCKLLQAELKKQKDDFDMKNRLGKNREAKDADKINDLKQRNWEMENEIKTLKNAHAEGGQHLQPVVDKQNQGFEMISHVTTPDNSSEVKAEDEYMNTLLTEKNILLTDNHKLSEEIETLHTHIQILEEAREANKNYIERLSAEKEELQRRDGEKVAGEGGDGETNIRQRCVDLQSECKMLEQKLNEEVEKNRALQELKKQMEGQLSADRVEIGRLQQMVQDTSTYKKDLIAMQDQLVAAQRAAEKHRRDQQQTWKRMEEKAKIVNDLEDKVNELTSELVAAKELINDLQEKGSNAQDVIAELREQGAQMRERMEEVEVLRMQLDVYRNDFEAERESREKQQATIEEERERVVHLQLENQRLKEELQKLTNHGVNTIRQRHGGPQTMMYGQGPEQGMDNTRWQRPPQQYQQQQNQQQQQQQQQYQQQQQQGNSGWQVYGRGSEFGGSPQTGRGQRHAGNHMQEDEQRKCPKCQEILPDLDSLQIHVMECLDK